MDIEKAIQVLEEHNKWRRGSDEITMGNATEIGIAIDTVLEAVKEVNTDEDVQYLSMLSNWYLKCHAKIIRVETGNLTIKDWRNEVTDKIKRLDAKLHEALQSAADKKEATK